MVDQEGKQYEKILQFAPFSSAVDAGFWSSLQRKKLEDYHLDESAKILRGNYVINDLDGLPSRFNIDFDALDGNSQISKNCFNCKGELHNTNTIESFKALDKQKLLESIGKKIWENIVSKKVAEEPTLLNQFILLTFADLKKYQFYYWFGFPALCPGRSIVMKGPARPIADVFTQNQVSSLQESYDKLRENCAVPYFLAKITNEKVSLDHIRNWDSFYEKNTDTVTVGFADPCTLLNNPGWPLRNFIAFISFHWGNDLKSIRVICYRDRVRCGVREISHSIIVEFDTVSFQTDFPKCVGWEKNHRQKLGPRMVDLSSTMDPNKLAESAVDLNLKLMRWRLMPELDLEKIAQTKCLLLGAGTLGCNVARLLLGWGVRTVTFVDNGVISYSNPVRQSLFEFSDSKDGGKGKAETAAAALQRIFPGVNSSWHNLSIPMPGHTIARNEIEEKTAQETVEKLDSLISEHDVVFLLLDTRESRWLPTVIAATKGKIVINAALGFDTYLVMRHGLKKFTEISGSSEQSSSSNVSCSTIPGHMLGCYFCNDVVAPGDSTKDRSLDQQCTVSRPGMSYIASSMAVELLVSVLQHPMGADAIADTSAGEHHLSSEFSSSLGLVPHQIRGFLSRFHQVLPASLAFDKCTACSEIVLTKYVREGFPFLLRAFNIPKYLEDLTGLTKLMEDTKLLDVWEFSEDEDSDAL
ncbi:ubiquitin-like modifier-activating enzyme ATG7 [Dendronephthya gigantea]|uniref:ubiquitin-like modifier-activating enzyme ATG7 n=1 Tax=Dendronephthya gigantea TaxID=151771 RepID=UPI00106DD1A5|nr:ubiquitin-like modifier-activating enzyme ATG7 [Dendronephthya gigantea]